MDSHLIQIIIWSSHWLLPPNTTSISDQSYQNKNTHRLDSLQAFSKNEQKTVLFLASFQTEKLFV